MNKPTCNVPNCQRQRASKGMCNLHYQRAIHGRPLIQEPKPEYSECTLDGCSNKPRTRYATYCAKHYHRVYRHGDPHKTASATGVTVSLGRRYRTRTQPDHPLAMVNGHVYIHRAVLFDAIGVGPHACHWCSTPIDWKRKGEEGNLVPDHLNGDGADNRLENLVPSCAPCNSMRGSQQRAHALREQGWWSNNDTIARLTGMQRRPLIESPA